MILASPAHLARHGCCPAKVIPQPREEDMQMAIEPDVFAKARMEVLEAIGSADGPVRASFLNSGIKGTT